MEGDAQAIAQMAQHIQQPHDDQQYDSPSNFKRKANDDTPGAAPQRARRNRYISIACNECKRRKIKCNGENPCQRCGNLSLECVYAANCCTAFRDSQEYREMSSQIASLQEQVNELYAGLSALREQAIPGSAVAPPPPQQQHPPIDPSLQSGQYSNREPYYGAPTSPLLRAAISPGRSRRKSQPQHAKPTFRGPTSSEFTLGVAQSSLQTMGITSQGEAEPVRREEASTQEGTPERDSASSLIPAQFLQTIHPEKDPIWSISKEEALRLCKVYEDEMGLMYPIMDMKKMVAFVNKLYWVMESMRRTGLMQQGMPGADAMSDEDTNILKMVLATALTTEASGRSELGCRLFNCVKPDLEEIFSLRSGSAGIKVIRLLAITAMYEFHLDDEGKSWRIIGLAGRFCIELGLHRHETYEQMQDEQERTELVLLFWSIFVLDRRWSFGTGRPFILQDSDIDPSMPKPGEASPYLGAMIEYSNIGSKVWRTITANSNANGTLTTDEMNEMSYLDYKVLGWQRNLPAQLRYEPGTQNTKMSSSRETASSRAGFRLGVTLYLRANTMRMHIHRRVLHTATSIVQHKPQAQTVVDVAKDVIRLLTHINRTSDLYRNHQVLFNAFLLSAVAVLFLSVAHAPVIFADQVREEFYLALDIVRGFSKDSLVSKALWKTIRRLKDLGPKLGLQQKKAIAAAQGPANQEADYDQSRSAAVAMAGLAGHNVDEMALYNNSNNNDGTEAWPASVSGCPEDMAHDLRSLFEAAGGYQALELNGQTQAMQHEGLPASAGNFLRVDEGLSNIFRELF